MAQEILNGLAIPQSDGNVYVRDFTQIDKNAAEIAKINETLGGSSADAKVAFVDKANQFTEAQTLVGKSNGTSDVAKVVGKSTVFDVTAKTVDGGLTGATAMIQGADKNNINFANVGVGGSASSVFASLDVMDAAGTALAGQISVKRNLADDKVTATAPTPDITSATKDEIVTVGFLNKALTGSEEPEPDGPTIGEVMQELQNVAYVNKANSFTAAQTIAMDSAVISGKAAGLTYTAGASATNVGTGDLTLQAQDNAGTVYGSLKLHAGADANSVTLAIGDGTQALKLQEVAGVITATAPSTAATAVGTEIATADFVLSKIKDPTQIVAATADNAGVIELATNEEALAGTDAVRAITPASLAHTLQPIKEELAAVESGVVNMALKDYTQTANQGEMLLNVIYYVAFNAQNQYLELDPDNGYQPKNPQSEPTTTDLVISYYVKMIKHSAEEEAVNAGRQYTSVNLQGVAYTEKANTFTQLQTLNAGAAVTGGLTSDTLNITGAATTGSLTVNTTATVTGQLTAASGLSVAGTLVGTTGVDIASGDATFVPNVGNIRTYTTSMVDAAKAKIYNTLTEFTTAQSGGQTVNGVVYIIKDMASQSFLTDWFRIKVSSSNWGWPLFIGVNS